MNEKDKITELFRHRLKQAELEVRDDFWESLQQDLNKKSPAIDTRKKGAVMGWFYRGMAAASVLLVLGMASAMFWFFSPKEEIRQAFTQVQDWPSAVSVAGVEKPVFAEGGVETARPSVLSSSAATVSSWGNSSFIPVSNRGVVSDTVHPQMSVCFSIRVSGQMYGKEHRASSGYADNVSTFTAEPHETVYRAESSSVRSSAATARPTWALKVAAGTALPKGDAQVPWIVGVSAERWLGKRWALESGLQYHHLAAGSGAGETLSVLSVPVKLNMTCADAKRWSCYATLGGALEKSLNKGFDEDPVRLSVSAGLGVAYKMNEKLALFVEPSISHHFDTDTRLKTLRTERPTQVNLLCGMRITY